MWILRHGCALLSAMFQQVLQGAKKRNRNDRSTVLSGTSLTQVTHSPPGSKGICPPARWRNVFIFAVYFVLTHKGDMWWTSGLVQRDCAGARWVNLILTEKGMDPPSQDSPNSCLFSHSSIISDIVVFVCISQVQNLPHSIYPRSKKVFQWQRPLQGGIGTINLEPPARHLNIAALAGLMHASKSVLKSFLKFPDLWRERKVTPTPTTNLT